MRVSQLLVPALLSFTLAGCPGDSSKGTAPSPSPTATAGVSTASVSTASWAAQADRVARGLDEVLSRLEKGDKKGALEVREKTYFEEYENERWNIEVASKQRLGEEPLDGRMRNIAQVREDAFGRLKGMIVHDDPLEGTRKLARELAAKIREDARQLDELKVPPP